MTDLTPPQREALTPVEQETFDEIVARCRARLDAARDRNRNELRPLLEIARLITDPARWPEADGIFTQLRELEPDWTEMLEDYQVARESAEAYLRAVNLREQTS